MPYPNARRPSPLLSALAGATFLTLASGAATAEESLLGATWLAEDIMGKGVIDILQTKLEVSRDGKVGGMAGCNRFVGAPEISGDTISFGPLAVTQKACLPSVEEQEQRFLKALSETHSYRFEEGSLYFLDAEGERVIRFTKLAS